MGFKNNIRHIAAVIGNTLLTTLWKFFVTLRVSSGRMESISCWILSFTSSRDRRLCLKTFPLGIPKGKSHMGVLTEREACAEPSLESLSQNGCSHNTLQQQSPDLHRSNQLWVLKTVETNQLQDTTSNSLSLLQPAQWPLEMWEIFMLSSVYQSPGRRRSMAKIPRRSKTPHEGRDCNAGRYRTIRMLDHVMWCPGSGSGRGGKSN